MQQIPLSSIENYSEIGPDDSVSNADFTTKQQKEIAKIANLQAEQSEDDDTQSRSISLSSVSMNQNKSNSSVSSKNKSYTTQWTT